MVRAFSPQRVWGEETWGCHPRLEWCWACGPLTQPPLVNPMRIWAQWSRLGLVLGRRPFGLKHQRCVPSQPGVTTPGKHPPSHQGLKARHKAAESVATSPPFSPTSSGEFLGPRPRTHRVQRDWPGRGAQRHPRSVGLLFYSTLKGVPPVGVWTDQRSWILEQRWCKPIRTVASLRDAPYLKRFRGCQHPRLFSVNPTGSGPAAEVRNASITLLLLSLWLIY
jgi:hypothetical protein